VSEARELLRKYLEQRNELGEGAVVLDELEKRVEDGDEKEQGKVSEDAANAAYAANVARAASPSPPSTPTPPSVSGGEVARPQAGITIQPPSTDLFTDGSDTVWNSLEEIAAAVNDCEKCRLCEARKNAVPGEGPDAARVVVVGEGPGAREDETGRPFVGRAGELLTDILKAIDLERESVFICNIVKCRPPSNRTPHQDEIDACVPYLYRQLEIVRPDVILAMGGTAVSTLLERKQSLGSFRGKVHSFRGMQLVATYHPAALLRNPNWKRPTWDDVRIARRLLD